MEMREASRVPSTYSSRRATPPVWDASAFIGFGATIIQNIRIGTDAVVGAGAVVIKDVPAAMTVVGVPARILNHPHREPPVRFPPEFHIDSLQEAIL